MRGWCRRWCDGTTENGVRVSGVSRPRSMLIVGLRVLIYMASVVFGGENGDIVFPEVVLLIWCVLKHG